MTTNHPSDFSFDTYPGLDRSLAEIYERNVGNGEATEGDLAAAGLAIAVNTALGSNPNVQAPTSGLSPEARNWVVEFNFSNGPMGSWNRYEASLSEPIPPSSYELLDAQPSLVPKIERLYRAKQAIIGSREVNPEGLEIGESMKPVLIPWRTIKNNLHRLPDWVIEMRTHQGVTTKDDYFDSDLLESLRGDKRIYRNPNPGPPASNVWLTADEYLDQKIATDGNWGVMLAQTTDDAGLKRIVEGPEAERSPDAMTQNGTAHFEIAGQQVDAMGIFEWLALTFQEDPSQLSSKDVSWLLANRLTLDGGEVRVPGGYFGDGQVRSDLVGADNVLDDARVRLAVMV